MESLLATNEIVQRKVQTKDWRKSQSWYVNGKSNECENYQKKLIIAITGKSIGGSTYMRINTNTHELKKFSNNKIPHGTEEEQDDWGYWTEDFDGQEEKNNKKLFYNLKFVCEEGGAQRRTLRELHHFIHAQNDVIKNPEYSNVYFINILDGKLCEDYKNCFRKFKDPRCFIGSMYEFQHWYRQI